MRTVLRGVSRAILDRPTIATGLLSPSRNKHIWALNNLINDRLIPGRKDKQDAPIARHKLMERHIDASNAWVQGTDGKVFYPSQIGAFVLTKMKEMTESYLGASSSGPRGVYSKLENAVEAYRSASCQEHKFCPTRMPEIGRPFNQQSMQLQAAFTSSLLSPPYSALNGLTRPPPPFTEITRNVVKYSRLKGRRKTVAAIKNRFYRLDWGGWISAIPGRARHLWKKSPEQRVFLRNHVLRKAKEVKMLEKFCTKYWIKKKYFVDDPYESYHTRDNFHITKGVQGIASTNLFKPPVYSTRQSKHRKWSK